ncbi:hypothetical protein [Capnocytophaga cynodegmi]|uniref:Uncharacterized protein n=1 Tax=Capnocytophaga cynodegmi TaxID=28189 RepID=A0A0B7HRQ0_9FLAO|nr:hypothetical protein [Capnocytophaga cynodegmi]CEN33676.1 hypothetical protein CCYN2B_170086 [Capnocytophaga cynodegmi]CEN36127.1 hypothetical protein CCYN74_160021 [Capnocytophaga cynodegmi]CEN40223.1 hypothetical protein CCYN49044_360018 [Capnocytophaga cynodegmi]
MNEKIVDLLNPELFKSNLILSGLFIAYFENTTDYIIDQPRSFFSFGYNSEKGDLISQDYKTEVLSLDKKPINASLKWFLNQNAINEADIEVFNELRKYRNKLSHELTRILLDEGLDSTIYKQNLSKLFDLRIKLEKWWFFWYEIVFTDIEGKEQLTAENVITGGEMIYKLFMDLLSDDENKASYYMNELKKAIK